MIEDQREFTDEERAQLAMFGMWKTPEGEWHLVLEKRVKRGKDACAQCRGYGQSGNPLCGSIRVCSLCKGSGKKQPLMQTIKSKLGWL